MSEVLHMPAIRKIEFINNGSMSVDLDNGRTFIVPLEKFPAIQSLSLQEKEEYEIIDEHNLSFLAIDDVYSVSDLLGLYTQTSSIAAEQQAKYIKRKKK